MDSNREHPLYYLGRVKMYAFVCYLIWTLGM